MMLSRIRAAPVRSAAARLIPSTRAGRLSTKHIRGDFHKVAGRPFHQTSTSRMGLLDDAKAFLSRLTLRAEASHILVKGTDAHAEYRIREVQKLLEQGTAKNESVSRAFAKAAARVSDCPSGQQEGSAAGSLGEFGRYSMVPEFDTIVFDEKSKPGIVYGPIPTKFGYHLILIHKRSDIDS